MGGGIAGPQPQNAAPPHPQGGGRPGAMGNHYYGVNALPMGGYAHNPSQGGYMQPGQNPGGMSTQPQGQQN